MSLQSFDWYVEQINGALRETATLLDIPAPAITLHEGTETGERSWASCVRTA